MVAMTVRRQTRKLDANHAEILAALKQAGCCVVDLSAVGEGCPDLLVTMPTWPHSTMLVEIKDGTKPPSARKLTPAQVDFHRDWNGLIAVVNSIDEAINAVIRQTRGM